MTTPSPHRQPAPVGRLVRHDGERWRPIGEPLPPFTHAPPDPNLPVAPWVLPREPRPEAADVVVIGELAHQLLVRCERDDPLYLELAEQTMLLHDQEATMAWLAEIELWVGRRLDPSKPWPTALPSGPTTGTRCATAGREDRGWPPVRG